MLLNFYIFIRYEMNKKIEIETANLKELKHQLSSIENEIKDIAESKKGKEGIIKSLDG